ncbi:hypothetical protein LPA07_22600 [Lactiplantibacillus paraplantarum]|nr:hypothetical protein LPA07_22600 [Lactiplantibacillus paraplantarum]
MGVWNIGPGQLQIAAGKAEIRDTEKRRLLENGETIVPNRQTTLKGGNGGGAAGENVPDN